MQTLFGPDEGTPPSSEEAAEVKRNSQEQVVFFRKRFLYSCLALLLSMASVVPFLQGHSSWVFPTDRRDFGLSVPGNVDRRSLSWSSLVGCMEDARRVGIVPRSLCVKWA